jgi:hypothetical protein
VCLWCGISTFWFFIVQEVEEVVTLESRVSNSSFMKSQRGKGKIPKKVDRVIGYQSGFGVFGLKKWSCIVNTTPKIAKRETSKSGSQVSVSRICAAEVKGGVKLRRKS